MKKNNNGFSVSLALTDYGNPIIYLITCITIIINISKFLYYPYNIFYLGGCILSIIFGFSIPTVKLLVGLNKIKFNLPVKYVFYVNLGIFISGLMLLKCILNINILLFISIVMLSIIILSIVYYKTKKFNNIAVLIGGIGYLLIYIALIYKSISSNLMVPIVFYCLAISLYIMLIGIGIKGNLKNAKVHWIIEISNIICQLMVLIGTIILCSNI